MEVAHKLPFTEYQSIVALNPSVIVHGVKSMKHLRYAWENPHEDNDDLLFGRAVHCLTFEPAEFESRYAMWDGRRAGKAYEEFRNYCQEQNKECLTRTQWDFAQFAALALVHDRLVLPHINSGEAEVTLLATEHGLQCKGRVDWISSDGFLIDLKTTRNLLARPFGHDFIRYSYGIKLGLYQRWLKQLTGLYYPAIIFAVEKRPPFDTAVIPIPANVLDDGADLGLQILQSVRTAIQKKRWPGVANDAEYFLDLPPADVEGAIEGAEEVAQHVE